MSENHKSQLEQQLWNIANTLRGKMDADELQQRCWDLLRRLSVGWERGCSTVYGWCWLEKVQVSSLRLKYF